MTPGAAPASAAWPALPVADWADTRDTLHLWTQIVGKVRMAHTPVVNHWWNIPLYVSARGLTTSYIPYAADRGFQMDLDLVAHELVISATDGGERRVALEPRSVADFHSEVMARLDELDLSTTIWTMPVEIAGAVPFEDDHEHTSYDAAAAHRFWRSLVLTDQVFQRFRARFVGKASPVHFFWGAFDLATSRFSGRSAPPHPGGAPHCGPHVMHEAYSHEVSSCGYWPGGGPEGSYYAYAYPEPDGFRDAPGPPGAAYDPALGEFLLGYDVVRQAPDPEAVLLEFLQATYAAAADHAGWDRVALERPPGQTVARP